MAHQNYPYNFLVQTTIADITDGTSNTFLCAERASPPFPGTFLSIGCIWSGRIGTNNSYSFDEVAINASIRRGLVRGRRLLHQRGRQ